MTEIIISGNQAVTMTSLELADFINSHRKEAARRAGEAFPSKECPELLHKNLLAKVPDVLGERSAEFLADLPDSYGRSRAGYRFPKREACLMAMSYSYELQAAVFDKMTALEQERVGRRPLTYAEVALANAQALVDLEREQAQQKAALARVETRVEQVAASMSTLTQRPANTEAITHIRPRIFKQYGIPAKVVDLVMRQLPYSPKPAGMVRHAHEEAEGGVYAVFWTKDVNAVFRRFVSECTRVTRHFATHPDIENRFRLKLGVETKEAA